MSKDNAPAAKNGEVTEASFMDKVEVGPSMYVGGVIGAVAAVVLMKLLSGAAKVESK